MAEYISLLSDDAAVQMQTVDKYIDAVKAKQEKVDPIEALELNDEIAFWEGVKAFLAERNGTVADNKEVENAAVAEATVPVAENEMQPVEVAQQTKVAQPTVAYNVLPAEQTSEQVSDSAMNSSNAGGNQSEGNLEMGADVLGRNNKLLFDNENNKGKVARY